MCILSFGKKFCVIESDSFDPENPQRECNRVIVDRFPPSRLQINPLPFTRYSQLTQSQWFFAFYSSNTFQHVADAFNCIGVSSAVLSNKSMSYFLFIFFFYFPFLVCFILSLKHTGLRHAMLLHAETRLFIIAVAIDNMSACPFLFYFPFNVPVNTCTGKRYTDILL